MLIGIQGGLGSGKTVLLTKYLLKDFLNGYTIFSNYHLKNMQYKELIVEDLLKNEKEDISLKNATLGIDELTVYVDCRVSASKRNIFFSYLVLQSRKRSVDLYYTTQDFSMIDKRVFHHTHIQILCYSIYDDYGTIIDDWKLYVILDCRDATNIKTERYVMNISPYYDYYDTDEIITPPELKKPKNPI